MFRIILIFFLVIFWRTYSCQNIQPYEAEELFKRKYYTAVWQYYSEKLKEDSLNSELNYKMGVCYLNSRSQKDKAIHYLKKATTSLEKKDIHQTLAYKQLGDANYIIGNFDHAIYNYEKYQSLIRSNSELVSMGDISHEIEMCKMAKELKELKDITSKFLNSKNNTKKNRNYSGFEKTGYAIATPFPDFKSKKVILKNDFNTTDFFEECSKVPSKNQKQFPKPSDSSKTRMETTIASSVDGQVILIYRDESGEANLYTSMLRGNEWMEPDKLSRPINNKNWESDEYISLDGNALYFASKREEGFGGKDIYKCEKLPNGDWGKAKNMGPVINTAFDEEAPFMFPDGKTFYFSSNRNRSKGGFDNYSTIFSDSAGWSIPVNIGYPLHENKISEPSQISQADTSINSNFISTFINQRNTPINVFKGIVDKRHIESDSPLIEITISDNDTKKLVCVYRPDSKTGRYSCLVPSGINNNVTFEAKGYLFHSENIHIPPEQRYFKLQKPVILKPITDGSKTILNNIFFEQGTSALSNTSEIELNRLYKFIKENPGFKIELSYTVDKKSSSEDIQLTEAKIQTVSNYLIEKGIEPSSIAASVYKSKRKNSSQNVTQNSEKLELTILAKK